MKTLIKKITSVNSEGVGFELTEKASLNGSSFQTKEWWVSWDKIGAGLFGPEYSDAESVIELQLEREG